MIFFDMYKSENPHRHLQVRIFCSFIILRRKTGAEYIIKIGIKFLCFEFFLLIFDVHSDIIITLSINEIVAIAH